MFAPYEFTQESKDSEYQEAVRRLKASPLKELGRQRDSLVPDEEETLP